MTSMYHLEIGGAFRSLSPEIANMQNLSTRIVGSKLKDLPEEFGNLSKIVYFRIFACEFTEFPNSITNLTSLRQLYIECATSTSLPDDLSKLSGLVNFELSAGPDLPESEKQRILDALPNAKVEFK